MVPAGAARPGRGPVAARRRHSPAGPRRRRAGGRGKSDPSVERLPRAGTCRGGAKRGRGGAPDPASGVRRAAPGGRRGPLRAGLAEPRSPAGIALLASPRRVPSNGYATGSPGHGSARARHQPQAAGPLRGVPGVRSGGAGAGHARLRSRGAADRLRDDPPRRPGPGPERGLRGGRAALPPRPRAAGPPPRSEQRPADARPAQPRFAAIEAGRSRRSREPVPPRPRDTPGRDRPRGPRLRGRADHSRRRARASGAVRRGRSHGPRCRRPYGAAARPEPPERRELPGDARRDAGQRRSFSGRRYHVRSLDGDHDRERPGRLRRNGREPSLPRPDVHPRTRVRPRRGSPAGVPLDHAVRITRTRITPT